MLRQRKGHRHTDTIPFAALILPLLTQTGKGKTRQAPQAKKRVNKMDKGIQIGITLSSGKKTCKGRMKDTSVEKVYTGL